MIAVKEVRFTLPHIELAGLDYGLEEAEPVLALHGWLDNAMTFARLIPKLQEMRIVALDFAGHGFSQHKPAGTIYQLWEAAFDVLAVADSLGWKRFSLLGHSMGAIIAAIVAAIRPEAVKQLMLVDGLAAFSHPAHNFPELLGKTLQGLVKSSQKRSMMVYSSIDEMIKKRQQGLVPISYEAACYLMKRGVTAVDGGYVWASDSRLMIQSPIPLTEDAAWSYVEAIQCPTCLILANKGLWINNKDFMQRLAKTSFQVEVLEGKHHLHLDAEHSAQAVADCFNNFSVQSNTVKKTVTELDIKQANTVVSTDHESILKG